MKVATKAKKVLRKASSHIPKNKKVLLAKVNRTSKGVNRYVTKNPYKMIGLSAVTGLCVGFLMHRH
jgi:ElaB/YqjD/DUF883 family membrane-anchored ribosome-binding protein